MFQTETHNFEVMGKLGAKILVVDDDPDVLITAKIVLRQKFELVETENSPQRLNFLLQQNRYDVILLDMNYSSGKTTGNEGMYWLQEILKLYPDQRVIMITAYADIKLAVEAMKYGASDFIVKPWDNEKLEATVHSAYQFAIAKKELQQLRTRQSHYSQAVHAPEEEIIGHSPEMKKVLTMVNKAASTEANILLLGENGTGKELMAKYIHQLSSRKNYPFIKVDVGSIPATLFESELFGHRKGSFTDAKEDRIGRIELANDGTLFLDEVGNLPTSQQVKLLSVLQNREVIPLGAKANVPINVRLICATNLAIREAVANGVFREDLLYRINTVEITLPPLRNRKEDIPTLAKHFLKTYTLRYRKEEKSLSAEALDALINYAWPGNIRELEHTIERAVILSDHKELKKSDFILSTKIESLELKESTSLEEMERNAIVNAIQKHHGNLTKVSKELGLGRTTLYRKMTKYGLAK